MAIFIETVSLDELKERFSLFLYKIFAPKIFKALMRGDDEKVLSLATEKTLKNARGPFGQTVLVFCIQSKKSELACALIQKGGSFQGDGSLINAAMAGDQAVIDMLLNNGMDPNDTSGNSEYHQGHTALMWATNRHYFGIMQSLLKAGVDVNAISSDNTTAAMYTSDANDKDLQALKILLEYRPNVTIKDWRGRDLLQEALDRKNCSGKPEMYELLISNYPNLRGVNA
ncbi:ankyrin repeat domain-containing protein [Microbulbifer sp. CAU 1566]|uniref:ankyrin repeat domain-containing protein n=1 Tax=Microbulbifer sp. CAU 1566 TaxID=2933269 RepID=UPI0020029BE2|nr:ankyrin repeat domain-containing protein [Microbulbifer sp. CAU 1566]MCK7598180.1 ankyrin repeat domain-containing protein [Microbulbifer sp. CAU 1566]